MSHPANRRRFIKATAGSSLGAWAAAGASGAGGSTEKMLTQP